MQNYINPRQREKHMIKSMILQETSTQKNIRGNEQAYYNPITPNRNSVNRPLQGFHPNYSQGISKNYTNQIQRERTIQNNKGKVISTPSDSYFRVFEEKFQKLAQIVQKHQLKLYQYQQYNSQQNIPSIQNIIQQTINYLKKPQILKQVMTAGNYLHNSNVQVYQHLFNFKLDLQALKQQISRCLKKKDFEIIINSNQQKYKQQLQQIKIQINNSLSLNNHKKKYINQSLQSVQNSVHLSLESLANSIQKINQQLEDLKTVTKSLPLLRSSAFQLNSKQSATMLKYQQILKIKQHSNIIINENLYYIDQHGFLLDSQNHYIIDQNGKQVQLDEIHLKILKKFDIIK